MSADRPGSGAARTRVSLSAVIGLLLGVLAFVLPAVPALAISNVPKTTCFASIPVLVAIRPTASGRC